MREFLPIGDLGLIPEPDLDDLIDREMAGRSVDYTCCLHADWRFGEIEADARGRVGHQYRGRRHSSLVEIIVKAVYDLEESLRRLHKNAPGTAVADFWRSWEVQQHIADFCGRLADSETARKLAGSPVDAALETERARKFVYEQLTAFALQILSAINPDLPDEPRAGLRRNSHAGRKANQEYNYAVAQVVEGIGAAWRLRLTDVCAALDQNNVPLSHSRKWQKEGCGNWEDVLDVDPEGLTKAIRHRLEWVRHHPTKSHSQAAANSISRAFGAIRRADRSGKNPTPFQRLGQIPFRAKSSS